MQSTSNPEVNLCFVDSVFLAYSKALLQNCLNIYKAQGPLYLPT